MFIDAEASISTHHSQFPDESSALMVNVRACLSPTCIYWIITMVGTLTGLKGCAGGIKGVMSFNPKELAVRMAQDLVITAWTAEGICRHN